MKNLPKEKRDRLLLIAFLTVVSAIVLYYLLICGPRGSAESIAKKIKEQKVKVTNGERLVASTADINKNLDMANRKLASVEDGMASGDMYAWIIQTVGRFGAERKVEIPQFSREVTADVGMFPRFLYKAAIFNVRGTAYFHDLGRFVADFENSFPFARVQNLELEPAAGSAATAASEGEKLAFRMEIVTLINPNTR